ncbi:uncharacterized protein ARB_05063 [Trichophyton benhamiae CBS 112371]|uniref:Vacuolar membrane protein n=1 Tax=Arthroderma benhamiae (strain ATCC MYA-4681 / CBS 112371) TaxID=663331 RepID=D4AL66_ARTBC|nr:uncharacterized protein ARB_05063 [Trichophyton benhamiae CBS 112371]EFE36125.1 hypothetical protein ARB_05063 [Trichophyton benhamiae CBS 112371]
MAAGHDTLTLHHTTSTTMLLAATMTSVSGATRTSTTTATATATGSPNAPGDAGNGKCELLGPFALVIQVSLGALALLVLVYKRWKERPQRPVKVWAFDVSKQVFGSSMLHLVNLLASMLSAGQISPDAKQTNPCSYYLLNLGIDYTFTNMKQTTLGIPILILILRVLNHAALYTPLANPPESIESGHYGRPPKVLWWFKQSMIYFFGLVLMKVCVLCIIYWLPFIVLVGDWALRWTEGNTAVQIFFVMLLFPVIMNAVQYYIIDIFIKKRASEHDPLHPHEEDHDFDDTASINSDRHRRSALLAGLDDEDDYPASDDEVLNSAPVIFSDDESSSKPANSEVTSHKPPPLPHA